MQNRKLTDIKATNILPQTPRCRRRPECSRLLPRRRHIPLNGATPPNPSRLWLDNANLRIPDLGHARHCEYMYQFGSAT